LREIPKRDLLILAGLTLLAAGLGAYCLGCKSLWWDEGYTIAALRADWTDLPRELTFYGPNPLYFVLIRLWGVLGHGESVIRSFSVLTAVATVPVVYLLGRELFDSSTGLWAAALTAVNSFVVEYAQEARGYSLLLFLVALSTLFLARAVKEPATRRWVFYGIAMGLAIATHIFAFEVLVAHIAAVALTRREVLRDRPARISFAALILLMPLFAAQTIWLILANSGVDWIPKRALISLAIVTFSLAGQTQAVPTLVSLSPLAAVLIAVDLVVIVPLIELARGFMRGMRSIVWPHTLLVLWFVVPVVGTFIVSFAFPMFLDRYLIVALPAIPLLTAVGLVKLPSHLFRIVAFGVLCTIAVIALNRVYEIPKENWRGIASYIQSRGNAGDALIFYRPGGSAAFRYYAERDRRPEPPFAYPYSGDYIDGSNPDRLFTALREDEIDEQRVWFIRRDSIGLPEHEELERLLYEDFEVVEERRFAGNIEVELLERT
jgi:uncharacterized membrane protein